MKKYFFVISFVIVVTATFVYVDQVRPAPEVIPAQPAATAAVPAPAPALPVITATTEHATFIVGEKTYSVVVAPNDTVIDAMHTLASTTDFTFSGHDYPGLGFFVDSINGKKSGDGMYWILYVNETSATSGASATTIDTNDVVEWKYEKGY